MSQYPHIAYYRNILLQLFNKHWIYFFFSQLRTRANPTIYWDGTLQALILHLTLFKCFAFLQLNMPRLKSDKNSSIRIIFIKIIIKNNIIKIYIKNTNFITRKYKITRIFIKIEYIFICL